jgi:hypothetical protein
MSKKATENQRIKWHLEHEKNCNCNPLPNKLTEKIHKNTSPKNERSF